MPVDAQLAALLEVLPTTDIGGAVTDVATMRSGMAQAVAQLPVTVQVEDVRDVVADGVAVRVYRPSAGEPLPLVLLVHGGGFVIGSVDTHDGLARRIARDAGAVVVSVEYRLAPEHPFPAAVDDCWAALRWAAAHADELGADPARVAVAGDSAGGNLAAVLTHLARGTSGPDLVFQLLLYPVTSGHHDWPSVRENSDAPVLTRRAMEWFAAQYAADGSVRSAPATAESFTGLPAAFVATAGADPLRDDGEAYAELLRRDGVAVQQVRYEPLVHGFAAFDGIVPACTAAVDECVAALRAALHP
ncbi:alpha/beta hydrolase [Rhodococcus antarcticus]|jgi:acetyl esterase|uniref:Alpha/beta hydrolase n=1 Tax=Rhodococcus antarcticus TaxID=2987751 RepID=A0ABY6P541_9NOCA|nr:alpha/beta hydrolase [Rhodococcus antarcticus]UZJ26198.1 alpha/beta hydrolase [Rhodococcus antarcticus]